MLPVHIQRKTYTINNDTYVHISFSMYITVNLAITFSLRVTATELTGSKRKKPSHIDL